MRDRLEFHQSLITQLTLINTNLAQEMLKKAIRVSQ
jgi:hypothetical protein